MQCLLFVIVLDDAEAVAAGWCKDEGTALAVTVKYNNNVIISL